MEKNYFIAIMRRNGCKLSSGKILTMLDQVIGQACPSLETEEIPEEFEQPTDEQVTAYDQYLLSLEEEVFDPNTEAAFLRAKQVSNMIEDPAFINFQAVDIDVTAIRVEGIEDPILVSENANKEIQDRIDEIMAPIPEVVEWDQFDETHQTKLNKIAMELNTTPTLEYSETKPLCTSTFQNPIMMDEAMLTPTEKKVKTTKSIKSTSLLPNNVE